MSYSNQEIKDITEIFNILVACDARFEGIWAGKQDMIWSLTTEEEKEKFFDAVKRHPYEFETGKKFSLETVLDYFEVQEYMTQFLLRAFSHERVAEVFDGFEINPQQVTFLHKSLMPGLALIFNTARLNQTRAPRPRTINDELKRRAKENVDKELKSFELLLAEREARALTSQVPGVAPVKPGQRAPETNGPSHVIK